MSSTETEKATLGAGCFWCVEAIYQMIEGVTSAHSGYSGGPEDPLPTYKSVCSGSGHAEVVQLEFDPKVVSFEEILSVFFQIHDPTTLNKQGNDVGVQYRSAIFYHSEEQKEIAERVLAEFDESGKYNDKIVTAITPFDIFVKAEDYHEDYFNLHGEEPYCSFVVRPKVEKFKKTFENMLKKKE
eukprot:TRINITY_DN118_c2_g1_i1.p1 TRINITY_DN118_c2_g1~~TRINITY_DN118_c2_g1_i1.p1  ORF type:complete len:209 (+),score=62.82 TRINITY_DN118_c2_g1_i1:77-628(+)